MITPPITQDDRNIAQRDLKMVALSLLELGALVEEHRSNPPFSSQVIASAARQMLATKRLWAHWDALDSVVQGR